MRNYHVRYAHCTHGHLTGGLRPPGARAARTPRKGQVTHYGAYLVTESQFHGIVINLKRPPPIRCGGLCLLEVIPPTSLEFYVISRGDRLLCFSACTLY